MLAILLIALLGFSQDDILKSAESLVVDGQLEAAEKAYRKIADPSNAIADRTSQGGPDVPGLK